MTFDLAFFLRIILLIPLIALLLAPLESVGWWAGWWFKHSEEPTLPPPPTDSALKTTQHNATQHNATQHNATQHNATQHNATQHNATQHGATQYDATQLNSNQQDIAQPKDSSYEHVVFYLTGIGGATETNDVPLEQRFLAKLKESLKNTKVIDAIYPYSVINRSLTDDRFLARFWRYALNAKITGRKRVGFLINLRNLFQVFVAADDRYGTFFHQGTASVMIEKLLEIGYDPNSNIPISIIGYSGGGQVAAGAAPYIARVVKAPVTVLSLGGVMSSNPLIDRIDRIVHVVSNKDSVARLAFIFSGRWPISFNSAWNRAKRKGRVSIVKLQDMQHDGPKGYLDEFSYTSSGQSYFDKTLETIDKILKEPVEAIPDDEETDILAWLNPNKRFS